MEHNGRTAHWGVRKNEVAFLKSLHICVIVSRELQCHKTFTERLLETGGQMVQKTICVLKKLAVMPRSKIGK